MRHVTVLTSHRVELNCPLAPGQFPNSTLAIPTNNTHQPRDSLSVAQTHAINCSSNLFLLHILAPSCFPYCLCSLRLFWRLTLERALGLRLSDWPSSSAFLHLPASSPSTKETSSNPPKPFTLLHQPSSLVKLFFCAFLSILYSYSHSPFSVTVPYLLVPARLVAESLLSNRNHVAKQSLSTRIIQATDF